MMKKLSVAIFALGFCFSVGVTMHSVRPHSQDFASEGVDLEGEIAQFLAVVQNPSFDGAACVDLLSRTSARLSKATPQDFAPNAQMQQQYRQLGVSYVRDLFNARLALRDRLKDLAAANKMTPECAAQAKEIYRISRTLEDLIGEYALGLPQYDEKNPHRPMMDGEPWVLTNPKFGKFQFKSGDVLLSRGTAFTSAAIAHMGNNDASFSHLLIANVDPKTGAVSMSEALIETGSYNGPMDQSLLDGKVRLAVFRFRDPNVAARAAALIHNQTLSYQQQHGGRNIPYDSQMNVAEHSKLFCSELVGYAYEMAGVRIPAYPSSVVHKSPYFMQRIGVNVQKTFLPMDIETDPQFDLVAEWRDYSAMNKIHMHDSVLAAIFDWMDQGLVFHDGAVTQLKTSVAYDLRRWPLFSSLLKTTVPESLTSDQMSMVQTLDQVSELMYDRLAAVNAAQMRKTGEWLTPAQMRIVLEHYRSDDSAQHGPLSALFSK